MSGRDAFADTLGNGFELRRTIVLATISLAILLGATVLAETFTRRPFVAEENTGIELIQLLGLFCVVAVALTAVARGRGLFALVGVGMAGFAFVLAMREIPSCGGNGGELFCMPRFVKRGVSGVAVIGTLAVLFVKRRHVPALLNWQFLWPALPFLALVGIAETFEIVSLRFPYGSYERLTLQFIEEVFEVGIVALLAALTILIHRSSRST